MLSYSQVRLLKSVNSMLHTFTGKFEQVHQFDCAVMCGLLCGQLDAKWMQIRHTLNSYPTTFPPEVLPEILTKYSQTLPLIEEAGQSEDPAMWLMHQLKPFYDYMNDMEHQRYRAFNMMLG